MSFVVQLTTIFKQLNTELTSVRFLQIREATENDISIRPIDDDFVSVLVEKRSNRPTATVARIFPVAIDPIEGVPDAKALEQNWALHKDKLKGIAIGGNHSVRAQKQCQQNYPLVKEFKKIVVEP